MRTRCKSGFDRDLIGFDRQRRKFLQLSASHSTRVSIPTTSISGPGLHVDGQHWNIIILERALVSWN